MKKVIAIFALAFVVMSCGSASTEATTDSTAVATDSAVVATDSAAVDTAAAPTAEVK
jgi:PBP1b-binding outer membrane lipoprotein LpoB